MHIPNQNDSTRKVGRQKEQAAAGLLKTLGYKVLEMNFSCRSGEVDIIAKDGEYLVFCEVKYRKSGKSGVPVEAVSFAKQRKITKVAYFYLLCHGMGEDTPVRFDVVSIFGENIDVIKNAFEAVE